MIFEDSFYLNLVTSEHATKPKYMAWVKTLLRPFIDIINLNDGVKSAFNLDTAVGVQLDILGKILVQSREMNFQPSDGSSPILGDEDYRLLLRAKVLKNQWKGTIGDFYTYWNTLFRDYPLNVYIIDNQDMQPIVVSWRSQVSSLIGDFLTNGLLIPKPAGLGLTIREIDIETIFGFYGTELNTFNTGTFWVPN